MCFLLTSCDPQAGHEVVDHRPDGSLEVQRHPESLDTASQRDSQDQGDVEPVDVLIPVGEGHLGICDMRLLVLLLLRSLSLSLSLSLSRLDSRQTGVSHGVVCYSGDIRNTQC